MYIYYIYYIIYIHSMYTQFVTAENMYIYIILYIHTICKWLYVSVTQYPNFQPQTTVLNHPFASHPSLVVQPNQRAVEVQPMFTDGFIGENMGLPMFHIFWFHWFHIFHLFCSPMFPHISETSIGFHGHGCSPIMLGL